MERRETGLKSPADQRLSWLIGGKEEKASHFLLAPASLWLLFFLLLPLAWLLALSFTSRGPYGSFVWSFSLENYAKALNPKYLPIVIRTVFYASATTFLCLVLGYPVAYYLSFYVRKNRRDRFLIGLMIPFWTSSLVAIYCWIIILGRQGLINNLLTQFGIIQSPLMLLNTPFSVILGMVYFYLPFMILPLYSSLEKIPHSYIEASHDLGAGVLRTFLKITLPLSLPGVFAGCILTFIPCMGDFLTAGFLGGPSTYLLGNLIENQFLMAQDWPFGAALTALLLLSLISGLYFHQKLEAREMGRA